MSGFLILLVKVNLAMGAAIILVLLVRRPLRTRFGAPIAYALWLLVPIASVASLLPPREVPAHVATVQAPSVPMPALVPSGLGVIAQGETGANAPPAAMTPLASGHRLFDIWLLLFAAWLLGTLFMAASLTRVQVRFSAAVRRGQAGPAVVGFFSPRIVTPSGFHDQFTQQEHAAILAHERVHLARQDARINALVALLRCLCWFNPLIHLGARRLRVDQELACDAAVVSTSVSHQTYARALLKSQLMAGVLPFGCNWPGPQHPLVERIALLQRKPPGAARRLAGMGLVLLAATFAGLGAWAAQPPVAAKSVTAPANPTGSDNGVDASGNVRASRAVSDAPSAPVQTNADSNPAVTAHTQSSAAPALPHTTDALPTNQIAASRAARLQINEAATTSATAGLPAAPPLPKEVAVPEALLASNDPPATPVQPPALALNDQPVGHTAARNAPFGPAQAASNTPPATSPYDKTAVPDARRATRHAMDDCNARLRAHDIKSNSEWASCSMAAERGYFTAIKLKNMDSFDAYAASYLALAADLDANRVSKILARRKANEMLKQFFVACDCEIKPRTGIEGYISPPGGIFGGGGYGGNSGNSLSGTVPLN
ncbi:MAG: M48 family metalloprotease [Alphaproteobacteria bacterium]|nr:M48 family metalloprotease [Alphaproteobacteria bacterium]